ncbi:hypothetical protein BC938DRAFT_472592 [Jimgerdemannia flammicorona]|uniref:Uncharacterized protein n=1 Tax=Jimgerdemannia flammicorona TaxID=994334 RepID=A0A433Q5S3_9FUNG|nr:hypothetical protein BC938DRAFT_472592 [Jimgerdemannia flammicorona]
MQKIDELKVDSEMDRYTKRIYDFLCEKGNNDLIKSHTNEHNLWDGAFCDKTPEYSESPHVGLVEVSGGTDGCSKAKLTSDLLKVAKGMQQQLKRVAMSVQGFDLNRCRRLKVVGAQIVSNHVYMQAMCCLDKNAFVMWEWADTILPRSMNDISSLHKTITSVLTFREVILSTRKLVQEMKKEEAELSENVVRDGLSSPLRPDESPWNDWFSDVKKNSRE